MTAPGANDCVISLGFQAALKSPAIHFVAIVVFIVCVGECGLFICGLAVTTVE